MVEILVDTSIWVDFFKEGKTREAQLLDELLEHNLVCTTNLIKAEIVGGAKSQKEFDLLRNYFNALPCLPEYPAIWEDITKYRFKLKRKGFNASIPDLMIAALAIFHNKPIFTVDKHFFLMRKELPLLRLIEERR